MLKQFQLLALVLVLLAATFGMQAATSYARVARPATSHVADGLGSPVPPGFIGGAAMPADPNDGLGSPVPPGSGE